MHLHSIGPLKKAGGTHIFLAIWHKVVDVEEIGPPVGLAPGVDLLHPEPHWPLVHVGHQERLEQDYQC